MRKLIYLTLLTVVISSCAITQYTVEPPPNVNLPKQALFISQSGTQNYLMQTIIDLENNEMVILSYTSNVLTNLIRTGIFLNPDDYKENCLKGTDAPFKEEEKEEKKVIQPKENIQ